MPLVPAAAPIEAVRLNASVERPRPNMLDGEHEAAPFELLPSTPSRPRCAVRPEPGSRGATSGRSLVVDACSCARRSAICLSRHCRLRPCGLTPATTTTSVLAPPPGEAANAAYSGCWLILARKRARSSSPRRSQRGEDMLSATACGAFATAMVGRTCCCGMTDSDTDRQSRGARSAICASVNVPEVVVDRSVGSVGTGMDGCASIAVGLLLLNFASIAVGLLPLNFAGGGLVASKRSAACSAKVSKGVPFSL